jgi:hypothetical protein
MGNKFSISNNTANKIVFQVRNIENVCSNYLIYEDQKYFYDKPIKEKCFEKLIVISRNIKEIHMLIYKNVIYGIYDFEIPYHIFLLSPNLSPTSYDWIVINNK